MNRFAKLVSRLQIGLETSERVDLEQAIKAAFRPQVGKPQQQQQQEPEEQLDSLAD